MPRITWTLDAYRLLVPDEQIDLFACQKNYIHLVERQLQLNYHADRTLCGALLPAHPKWLSLHLENLVDSGLCPLCRDVVQRHRRGEQTQSYW